MFGSFLSLWSTAVIHNEHLKKPDGTLGLGNPELMKLFELFQTMNELPVIRIFPIYLIPTELWGGLLLLLGKSVQWQNYLEIFLK